MTIQTKKDENTLNISNLSITISNERSTISQASSFNKFEQIMFDPMLRDDSHIHSKGVFTLTIKVEHYMDHNFMVILRPHNDTTIYTAHKLLATDV